jgi:hypothetical protein
MRHSRMLAVLCATTVASALCVNLAPGALAAPKPGGKCPKAGITVHVGNSDVRCTKKGKALVWVKLNSRPGASGGSGSGGTLGIASSAQIPKVIQNWGLALAPYDAASGKAGVMQIAGVTPPTFGNPEDDNMYSRIVGLYGEKLKGVDEPQMAFVAPLGTPVISMVDGTVCDLPTLYSNDFSVRVAPAGMTCMGNAASVLFEHEHLLSPSVKVGDKVKAGQQIGVVSDFNPHWKAKGMGIIETGVFFSKSQGDGRPWHACLANSLDPAKAASLTSTLSSIEQGWMAARGNSALYNLAAQNPVGCLTQADITDGNSGVKQ